ncbi:MAG: hypothetical protein S4CHLAM102_07060 [Chlamydiia bacterium]|nr:hypothetical protein [Chlamydiia bacterium]
MGQAESKLLGVLSYSLLDPFAHCSIHEEFGGEKLLAQLGGADRKGDGGAETLPMVGATEAGVTEKFG